MQRITPNEKHPKGLSIRVPRWLDKTLEGWVKPGLPKSEVLRHLICGALEILEQHEKNPADTPLSENLTKLAEMAGKARKGSSRSISENALNQALSEVDAELVELLVEATLQMHNEVE